MSNKLKQKSLLLFPKQHFFIPDLGLLFSPFFKHPLHYVLKINAFKIQTLSPRLPPFGSFIILSGI